MTAPYSSRGEKAAIDVLIRFSRLISSAAAPSEVLPMLARAAVDHIGADAAAVIAVTGSGDATLAAAVNLPSALDGWTAEPDATGNELGDSLIAASGGVFASAFSLPLVSAGSLFGSLVLLFRRREALDENRIALVEGLVDMTATGLNRAAQYAELSRSYAELRASREVLKRTHKLRALGQMAAGVSHDLRNILNPLSLHLQFLKRAIPRENADAQESIVEMMQVLKRGLETIERLRDFSRQTPAVKVDAADLDALVHEAVEIGKSRARSNHADASIRMVIALGAPPRVAMSANEILSALVNLIVNAIDAMSAGGTITISTGAEAGDGWVRVADDGPGMPPEVEQRVFEPFFTTKGDDGTGLGLAMVYASIQRHGGRLSLVTAPGAGASFTLWIPRAPAL